MPIIQPPGLTVANTRPFPTGFEVALLGDSRNATNHTINPAPTQQTFGAARGWAIWAQTLTRGAISFPPDLNFAVSGTLPSDMVLGSPSPADNAATSRAGMVVIHSGTNAFNTGGTASDQIAYVTTAIKKCIAAGKMVGIFAETPRGNSGTPGNRLSAANLQQQLAYRDWVRRKSGARSLSPLVFVIDLWPDLADQTYNLTTGDILNAYTYDTTHLNVAGSYQAALRFLQSIGWSSGNPAALYLPQSFLLESACDLFDPVNLKSGNLVTNGMLGSTGGGNSVAGFGVAGVFPTGWTASNVSPGWQSGSPTLVGSQQTNARGNWWQAALGGSTGTTANPSATISQTVSLTNLSPGDVLRMAADYEVDAAAAGFTCPYLSLQASLPASASNSVRDFHPSDADAWGPIGLIQGTLKTPPLTISGTETAVTASLNLALVKSSTVSASVRFRKIRVWKEV